VAFRLLRRGSRLAAASGDQEQIVDLRCAREDDGVDAPAFECVDQLQ
jgi:hypothetical protein